MGQNRVMDIKTTLRTVRPIETEVTLEEYWDYKDAHPKRHFADTLHRFHQNPDQFSPGYRRVIKHRARQKCDKMACFINFCADVGLIEIATVKSGAGKRNIEIW